MTYTPEERELARYIATALQDEKSIGLHLHYVKTYPREFLMKTLKQVLAKPADKITSSRGAYYNHLVQQHA